MKRHAAFQDLSRDHHTALLTGMQVQRAAVKHPSAPTIMRAVGRFSDLWRHELCHHFDEEDVNLTPILNQKGAADLLLKLQEDHGAIRAMMDVLTLDSEVAAWVEVADRLRLHIRWEEEELFPWMQENLDVDELQRLLDASVAFRTEVRGEASVQKPRQPGSRGRPGGQ